jgi:hypothetical protein
VIFFRRHLIRPLKRYLECYANQHDQCWGEEMIARGHRKGILTVDSLVNMQQSVNQAANDGTPRNSSEIRILHLPATPSLAERL